MVKPQPSKLDMWVRFPSPAPVKWVELQQFAGMLGAEERGSDFPLKNSLLKSKLSG
jgi:hypothetical protein